MKINLGVNIPKLQKCCSQVQDKLTPVKKNIMKIFPEDPAGPTASSPLHSPSPSSQLQPLAPVNFQTTFNPTSYQTLPAPASCQSPLPYPNSQPITFYAEEFQLPVASAGTPRCAPNFSPEDVTLQNLLTAVTELTKEVKDLRQDFREFRQSCRCGQSAGVVGLTEEPLKLPLHSMEELENAEVILQSQETRKAMVARFTIIGGTTLEIRVRRMLAYSMTNELASGLNWTGKKNKDVGKQKRSFKEMALCKCMFDALTQRLTTANAYDFALRCATPQTEREELEDRCSSLHVERKRLNNTIKIIV
ncbi:uncharacterized protein LOC127628593 [Xyrauchen texanus]|uniref:uncharacterized protein LOC127628593 n=1 Tax=Xyrauchen texanus TaxID=154827 RepID=UPI002242AAE1|nr:uncharacterized protein LOC127628593 [Xyrauchen texanus]